MGRIRIGGGWRDGDGGMEGSVLSPDVRRERELSEGGRETGKLGGWGGWPGSWAARGERNVGLAFED